MHIIETKVNTSFFINSNNGIIADLLTNIKT